MMPKLGRNERCWCGSGKKFKKCHLYRESMPPRTIQAAIETAGAAYAQRFCLHPDSSTCDRGIIRAHSIQQNGGLSRIAVNGRVYGIREINLGDLSKHNGLIAPKLVGTGLASTFSGMCGFHDDQTFAPIERKPFEACPEHAFLLAYRHLCKEVFTRRAAKNLFSSLRTADAGQPYEMQLTLQHSLDVVQSGFAQGSSDAEIIKARYDTALLAKDYTAVRYYVVRFSDVPSVLCCSGNFPVADFDGNGLQRLLDDGVPDHVAFSIIATESGGAVVFSWLGDCPFSEQLVKSLHILSDTAIANAIVRYTFEFCENIYLAPAWWDSLDNEMQTALRRRITEAVDVTVARRNNCLTSDGFSYVDWGVTGRESNLDSVVRR